MDETTQSLLQSIRCKLDGLPLGSSESVAVKESIFEDIETLVDHLQGLQDSISVSEDFDEGGILQSTGVVFTPGPETTTASTGETTVATAEPPEPEPPAEPAPDPAPLEPPPPAPPEKVEAQPELEPAFS